jgi:spore coat polysaccharide biosynthesis protein SpsF (cytidylyltransferase family)
MAAKLDDFSTYLDFARHAAAPIGRINELAARNAERVMRLNYDLAGDWVQFAIEQMHATVTARDVGTLLSRQAEVACQFAEKAARRQQDLARLTADSQADFARWVDEASTA